MVQWPEKLDEKLAKDVKKYNEHFSTEILETRDKFGKNGNLFPNSWHLFDIIYPTCTYNLFCSEWPE